jgi:hypothetical protein
MWREPIPEWWTDDRSLPQLSLRGAWNLPKVSEAEGMQDLLSK